MKASVERLRWGLAAAAVVLLVVLAGFLSYGRYRAGQLWQKLVNHSGGHITHETDGFTYSQTLKGRTVFTLHAAKAIQHGDGTWTLHDVIVTLYGKTPEDVDHVYCSDVEYNENTGVATALGEVNMDMQVPGGLAESGRASKAVVGASQGAEGDRKIHVKTSGLVFVRKLGVAATQELVEFRYAGMQCTAKGAEFESGDKLLHLLADVVVTGEVRHAPLTVHAVRADLDRNDNSITMVQPVGESRGRTASADHAVLHLRNDGSLEAADGSGSVRFDAGTRHVTAGAFTGTFGLASLPIATKLSGGVAMTDSNAARPMQARASQMDTSYTPQGEMSSLLATGSAQVAFTERRAGVPDLAREMRGDRILATFKQVAVEGRKSVSRLSEIHATGGASAKGDAFAVATKDHSTEMKTNAVFADDLRAVFDVDAGKKAQVRQLVGSGSTKLEQTVAQGAQQSSTGDSLDIEFTHGGAAAAAAQIASATQVGHVVVHSLPAAKPGTTPVAADASADRAVYDGATEELALSGDAHFSQGDTAMSAATIGVDQRTGDATAEGGVVATMSNTKTPLAQMTHVSADRAHLVKALETAEFFGSEARPARLWQGASQVQAADLLFDQKRRSLVARPVAGGVVHAVFASVSDGKKRAEVAQVVRVSSALMDYDDLNREATFTGGVHVDGDTGRAEARRAVVLLTPAEPKPAEPKPKTVGPLGGAIRQIVMNGDVTVEQPERTGTGEQLVYTAADQSFILTGTAAKPPVVKDAQQGSVTGATLLFHKGDKSVVAVGGPAASAQAKPGRVRTETQVKQQPH